MKEENREKGHGWIELVRLAVTPVGGVTSGQENEGKGGLTIVAERKITDVEERKKNVQLRKERRKKNA